MLPFYGVMCVLGTILSLSGFLPWLITFGLDWPQIWQVIAHPLSAFAWLGIGVSVVRVYHRRRTAT